MTKKQQGEIFKAISRMTRDAHEAKQAFGQRWAKKWDKRFMSKGDWSDESHSRFIQVFIRGAFIEGVLHAADKLYDLLDQSATHH